MAKTLEKKTIIIQRPHKLVIQTDTIKLDNLDTNEIVAETVVSVVSPGTETAAYAGMAPLRPGVDYPRLVGYCNVGRVLKTGIDVKHIEPGNLILTLQPHCSAFKCKENAVLAILPNKVNPLPYASAYLYHLGYSALLQGGYFPGHKVAVIGMGTLGLATVALTETLGGVTFAISGRPDGRERARLAGAKYVSDSDYEAISSLITKQAPDTELDLVITTSNNWQDWELALKISRQKGKIIVMGFPGRDKDLPDFNPLASEYFYFKQLQIIACGMEPDLDVPPSDLRFTIKRNLSYLLELITQKDINPEIIISETVPWTQIESVYKRLLDRDTDMVTCGLLWNENII